MVNGTHVRFYSAHHNNTLASATSMQKSDSGDQLLCLLDAIYASPNYEEDFWQTRQPPIHCLSWRRDYLRLDKKYSSHVMNVHITAL